MKFSRFATASAAALFVVGLTHQVSLARSGRDMTSVNGSVNASAGESYDTLSAVNGDVHVARGASAEVAKTVNGDVKLEADTKVGTVSTVNGSLDIGGGANVARTASTVNGSIDLEQKARVGGDVTTVSGDIDLTGAEVAGRIETRNGDIKLRDGARVLGGIHVRKQNDKGWNWNRDDKDDPVKVNICATCTVQGDMVFDRAVVLTVEPGAKIGGVIGDDVKRR
jgi:DUF4097 and DUF4098 domain-containing protein YvlB